MVVFIIAITESFVAAIIEAGLKAILKLDREHDEFSHEELEHISAEKEEIWSAVGAASRLSVDIIMT